MALNVIWIGAIMLVFTPFGNASETFHDPSQDLEIVAERLTPEEMKAGRTVKFGLSIKNRSVSHSCRLFVPGDGSQVGWRPPHVYATVEYQNRRGQWETVEPFQTYARCGMFDWEWRDDFVELEPGQSFKIKDWVSSDCSGQLFSRPGNYRIQWHYDFNPTKFGKGHAATEPSEKDLQQNVNELKAFKLTSKPQLIKVAGVLKLSAKFLRQVQSTPSKTNGYVNYDLASLLRIHAVNISGDELKLTPPSVHGDSRVYLEIRPEASNRTDHSRANVPQLVGFEAQDRYEQPVVNLKPGQSFELTQSGQSNGLKGTWETTTQGKVKIRVVFMSSIWTADSAVLQSEWQSVDLGQ